MTVIPGLVAVHDAPCTADPELFFSRSPRRIEAAKAICAGCPYARGCLLTALAIGDRHGIWGGKSQQERRTMPAPPRAGPTNTTPRKVAA